MITYMDTIKIYFVGGPLDGLHADVEESLVSKDTTIPVTEDLLVKAEVIRDVAKKFVAATNYRYEWEEVLKEHPTTKEPTLVQYFVVNLDKDNYELV